jgi:hypothetical protein
VHASRVRTHAEAPAGDRFFVLHGRNKKPVQQHETSREKIRYGSSSLSSVVRYYVLSAGCWSMLRSNILYTLNLHPTMIKISSSTAAVTKSASSFEIMSSDATSGVEKNGADDITNSNVCPLVDAAIVISLPATIGDSTNDIDQVALLSESNSDEEQRSEDAASIETLTKPDCCKCCYTTLVMESRPRMGHFCCTLVFEPCQRIGNCRVIFPQLYQRTGFGIVGPHWVGFLSTLTLVIGAGALVTRNAVNSSATESVESVKPILCIIFTAITSILLCLTGCNNPGIVTEANCGYTGVSSGREWRWCQVCR